MQSSDIPWLQPFPDHLLEHVASSELGARRGGRHPRDDRAGLRRRYPAPAAAAARCPHPARRARPVRQGDCRLARHDRDGGQQRAPARSGNVAGAPADPAGDAPAVDDPNSEERAVLARYMAAHDQRDESALAALLREDVRLLMPPHRGWYAGRATVMRMAALGFDPAFGQLRGLPTAANRQPAVAWYLRRPDDTEYRALALDVLQHRTRSDCRDHHLRVAGVVF